MKTYEIIISKDLKVTHEIVTSASDPIDIGLNYTRNNYYVISIEEI